MKVASIEIRSTVVRAYLSGKASKQQLADIFGFHVSAINRWLRQFRVENRLAPRARGHMPAAFSPEECERLAKLIQERPDITLAEIKEYFSKTCSLMSIHRTLSRLGLRYKKNSQGKRTRQNRHS